MIESLNCMAKRVNSVKLYRFIYGANFIGSIGRNFVFTLVYSMNPSVVKTHAVTTCDQIWTMNGVVNTYTIKTRQHQSVLGEL